MNIVAEAQRALAPTSPPSSPKLTRDVIDDIVFWGGNNILKFKAQYDSAITSERIQFCEYWIPRIKPFRFKNYLIALIAIFVLGAIGGNLDLMPAWVGIIFLTRYIWQRGRRGAIRQFLLWYDSLRAAWTIHNEQMKKATPFETWLDSAVPEWRDRNPADVAQHIVDSKSADDIFLVECYPLFQFPPYGAGGDTANCRVLFEKSSIEIPADSALSPEYFPSTDAEGAKYPPEYYPIEQGQLKAYLEYTINELVQPVRTKGGSTQVLGRRFTSV